MGLHQLLCKDLMAGSGGGGGGGVLAGFLIVEAGVCLTPLPALRTLFFILGCLVQPWYEAFVLSYMYLKVSCCVVFGSCFLEACSFLDRRQRGSGFRKRVTGELGEVEGGGTAVRMHCMREDSIFTVKCKTVYANLKLINKTQVALST